MKKLITVLGFFINCVAFSQDQRLQVGEISSQDCQNGNLVQTSTGQWQCHDGSTKISKKTNKHSLPLSFGLDDLKIRISQICKNPSVVQYSNQGALNAGSDRVVDLGITSTENTICGPLANNQRIQYNNLKSELLKLCNELKSKSNAIQFKDNLTVWTSESILNNISLDENSCIIGKVSESNKLNLKNSVLINAEPDTLNLKSIKVINLNQSVFWGNGTINITDATRDELNTRARSPSIEIVNLNDFYPRNREKNQPRATPKPPTSGGGAIDLNAVK